MHENNRYRILIVDDSICNIEFLRRILSPEYDIITAQNGKMALTVALEDIPDIILLDIIMPDMTGFDVLKELKKSDHTEAIPVIFITGLDSSSDEEKGLLLGAVDYITKPFNSSIVKARVSTHLKIVEYIRTIHLMGMVDALTDIPNRRGFDHQLDIEWRRAMRIKKPISVLMIDVDKFKDINDTYGHAFGDEVLRKIAKNIGKNLKRPADFAGRWGGEEFAVLLPDTDLAGGLEVAEHIRKGIASTHIRNHGTDCDEPIDVHVTVSIGVSSEIPQNDKPEGYILLQADKALYDAKNAGRNAVCAYGP